MPHGVLVQVQSRAPILFSCVLFKNNLQIGDYFFIFLPHLIVPKHKLILRLYIFCGRNLLFSRIQVFSYNIPVPCRDFPEESYVI